jgi:hypothetical protein
MVPVFGAGGFVRRLRIGAKDDDRLPQQSIMSGAAQLLAPGAGHAVIGLRETDIGPVNIGWDR